MTALAVCNAAAALMPSYTTMANEVIGTPDPKSVGL
jgi:hypothetical protein